MTTVVITQPMLFPWPGFFEQLALADVYLYLDDAQFSKGSFTNRIQLRFGAERRWMSIPLAGKGSFQLIAELAAAGDGWKASHRSLLQQSLADAPHRADALALFDEVYAETSLCELLIASIEAPARYLGIGGGRRVARTSQLAVGGASWRRVLDLVRAMDGSRYVSGHGAAAYLDHEAFEREGVAFEYMAYSMTRWLPKSRPFTPYVSILDLIAHTGRGATQYLVPATTPWRSFLTSKARNP